MTIELTEKGRLNGVGVGVQASSRALHGRTMLRCTDHPLAKMSMGNRQLFLQLSRSLYHTGPIIVSPPFPVRSHPLTKAAQCHKPKPRSPRRASPPSAAPSPTWSPANTQSTSTSEYVPTQSHTRHRTRISFVKSAHGQILAWLLEVLALDGRLILAS
jgi:hypothetical protein